MPKYLIQFVADVSDLSPDSPPDYSGHNGSNSGIPHLTNCVEQNLSAPPLIPPDNFDNPLTETLTGPLLTPSKKTLSKATTALSLNQNHIYTSESDSNVLRPHAISMGNAACCLPESEHLRCLHSAALNTAYTPSGHHQPTIQRMFLMSRAVQCTDLIDCGHNMCNNHNYQSSLPSDSHVSVVRGAGSRADPRMARGIAVSTNFPHEMKQTKSVDTCAFVNRRSELFNSRSELSVDVSSLSLQKCSSVTSPIKQPMSSLAAPEEETFGLQCGHNDEDIDSLSATVSAVSPLVVKDIPKPVSQRTAACGRQNKEVAMENGYRIRTLSEDLKTGRGNADGCKPNSQTTFGPPCSASNLRSFERSASKHSHELEDSLVRQFGYSKRSNGNKGVSKRVNADTLNSCTAGNSIESVTEECTSVPMEETELINATAPNKQLNANVGVKPQQEAFLPVESKAATDNGKCRLASEARTLREYREANPIPAEKWDQWKENISSAKTETLLQRSLIGTHQKDGQECSIRSGTNGVHRMRSPKDRDDAKVSTKIRSLSESRIPISQMWYHPPACRPPSITLTSANGSRKFESNPVGVTSPQTTHVSNDEPHNTLEGSGTKSGTETPVNVSEQSLNAAIITANDLLRLKSAKRIDLANPLGEREALVQPASECLVTETCPTQGAVRKRQSHSLQPRPSTVSEGTHDHSSRVFSNVLKEEHPSIRPVSTANYPTKRNTNQNSSCVVLSQEGTESTDNQLNRTDPVKFPGYPTSSLSKIRMHKNGPLASPPGNLFTGRRSNESVASAPLHYYAPRSGHGTKLVRRKFYIPESANIEAILADPDDRRIKAICERYKCDVEVYSKLPWCGFLQYIVVLAARDSASLRLCARTLDYRLNWCLSAQLR
ncbi:unnamed protein product [Dicrocoelium dendriticum]|nr:unnamed protein product [Dicrocoelium dendriticum]